MIFTPGHRRDLIEKAIASGTDAVIVDLEDAVAMEEKAAARDALADLPPSPIPIYVRTNAIETGMLWDDVIAAGQAGVDGLVIPKAEDPGVLREIDGALRALEVTNGREIGSTAIVPLIESGVGVRANYDMMRSSDRVQSVLYGGGEQGDLVADLGVTWTPEGTGLMYSRAKVLMDARAAGIQYPMEAVFMDFRNLDAFRVECEIARTLGYVGKVAIHPMQIPVIHEVFTPSDEDVAHQRHILDEFEKALAAGSASIAVDGKMVDYAVARVARAVLARAAVADRAKARSTQHS
ncbi:MAG: citrate lyase subunit beta/citryl-CoA lyase [Minisyncoccia bacterium]|jgi:citrate lyase subunit beta/citryl-CoA lyase